MSNTHAMYVNARASNGTSVYTGNNLAQLFVSSNGTNTFTFKAITNTTQLLFEKATYGQSSFYIDNVIVEEQENTTSNYYFADVIDASDYSPFGAPLSKSQYGQGFQRDKKKTTLK
jgi:hypothetical protein